MKIDFGFLCTARIINRPGEVHQYQDGDVIGLFINHAIRNEERRNPRTTATLASERPVQQPAKTKMAKGKGQSKAQCDWMRELISRVEEEYHHDAHEFWRLIDQSKMIQVATDGGSNPNPGLAGWGAIFRQNWRFTVMWQHFPHATNNTMELMAAAKALKYLAAAMVV
jgi:hypothetical protein